MGPTPRPSLVLHPWTLFLATSALAVANQVAFGAFILGAHGGDTSFVTRYTGAIYFHQDPTFPGVQALAYALGPAGAERWLSPSLLRVNAFLELPFALFAYLSITRLFDRAAARRLQRGALPWLAAASFTIVLCLIEILLWNPWTVQDLVIRVASCLACGLALSLTGRRERTAPIFPAGDGRPRGIIALLAAVLGATAIAAAVLVLYDVTLLYNLVDFHRYSTVLIAALVVATASFLLAGRLDGWLQGLAPPSDCVAALGSVASALSVLFFVPSLAVRYGLARPVGRGCGVAIVALAVVLGLWSAVKAPGVRRGRWIAGLVAGLVAGCAAVAAVRPALGKVALAEAALVFHLLAFAGPLLLVWRSVEIVTGAKDRTA